MGFDSIIFDLDGTLTDSGRGILNSIKYAVDKLKYRELSLAEMRSCVGPPLAEHIRELLGISQEESTEFLRVYREYFSVKGIYENDVYEGIPQMLARLKEAGKRIMLCTGKPEPFAREVLRYFNIDQYFDDVLGPDFDGKYGDKADGLAELLRRSGNGHYIMVGDRKYDLVAAKACGIASVGVLWGYGSEEELTAYGADYTVHTVNQLTDLMIGNN